MDILCTQKKEPMIAHRLLEMRWYAALLAAAQERHTSQAEAQQQH